MKYLKKLRQLIDNAVSMYLLITLALFTLFGAAFTASLSGLLPFRAFDLVLCLAVFMGVSLGASYVWAYLFSVKAHHKSALITGGILFCIFSPIATPANLILYGLAAVLAMGSKYLLAWRGRHLFNPAAIAAVIVLLAGLQPASWWMADGAFAIPVTLLALIVLYKTERLQFAGVFVAIYMIVLGGVALAAGQAVGPAIWTSFAAWFPAFFAGFMLSEPQTLPARRYQLFIVAVVVACLIGLHPSIGSFYLTPELALVAGNIVSFAMTRRVGIKLTLIHRKKFAGGQEMFEFRPMRPLKFQAGQYLELSLPHAKTDLRGERRMFTIASAPESETVKITTRYAEHSSTFKAALRELKKGDTVSATAIRGDFLLPDDTSKKLLMIAGGIGITPFRAQLESLQRRGHGRDVLLIHCVRSVEETLFKDILFPKEEMVHTIVLAPDAKKDDKHAIRAQFLTAEILKDAVPDIRERTVFISGPSAMVASLQAAAKELGAEHIKTDSFVGY